MNWWNGRMDWPLDERWRCEVCEESAGLTWGLRHGECRCNRCHAQYMMRSGDEILTIPESRLKPEYQAAARAGWEAFQRPLDDWNDTDWDRALELAG